MGIEHRLRRLEQRIARRRTRCPGCRVRLRFVDPGGTVTPAGPEHCERCGATLEAIDVVFVEAATGGTA